MASNGVRKLVFDLSLRLIDIFFDFDLGKCVKLDWAN